MLEQSRKIRASRVISALACLVVLGACAPKTKSRYPKTGTPVGQALPQPVVPEAERGASASLVQQGLASLEQGVLPAAYDCFEKAFELDPTNAEAALRLGEVSCRQEQYRQGQAWLEKATRLQNNNPDQQKRIQDLTASCQDPAVEGKNP